MSRRWFAVVLGGLLAGCTPAPEWTGHERTVLRSLSLDALPPARDPSNRVAHDPAAIELGRALFHDVRLSANGAVSCATCHRPDYAFADPGRTSRGVGETRRHAPSLVGAAWSQWYYWDGRRDSLWAQALTPLEHPQEQAMARRATVELVAAEPDYSLAYQRAFGSPVPGAEKARARGRSGADAAGSEGADAAAEIDRAYADIGKALAAFVTTLRPQPGRFDHYLAALQTRPADAQERLGPLEREGLHLFIGKARCTDCHNGPLLTNHGFHNVGTALAEPAALVDLGRWQGVREALNDPFNCLGAFSDATADQCPIRYARMDGAELVGAFKVPGLRGVAGTPPYMHDGQFQTLEEVVDHYVQAPTRGRLGHQEIAPLSLSEAERRALVAFLRTLD